MSDTRDLLIRYIHTEFHVSQQCFSNLALYWLATKPLDTQKPQINWICPLLHDGVIKWNTFSALLALCAGNSPFIGYSPLKGHWRRALKFSLICAWINAWLNNRESGNLRRRRAHYDVIVMEYRNFYTYVSFKTKISYSSKSQYLT